LDVNGIWHVQPTLLSTQCTQISASIFLLHFQGVDGGDIRQFSDVCVVLSWCNAGDNNEVSMANASHIESVWSRGIVCCC
jgi:hypothetical protein